MNRIDKARLTRREFVSQVIAGTLLISQRPLFALSDATPFPFVVVPPEKSGIKWVHSSGKSPEKYLPESSGPGCAFLDYDNDGWMDIYLVNSGKCDFFTPNTPLRNALYRNNRDGTFT
ncbi:MAG: VCBS repeat-containing protein, partial [Silvibacterium sp.]